MGARDLRTHQSPIGGVDFQAFDPRLVLPARGEGADEKGSEKNIPAGQV